MANDLKARQAQQVIDGKLALADYDVAYRTALFRASNIQFR
jgi:hypothetical protein